MKILPEKVVKLIDELQKLPGVGHKSAARMAYYFFKKNSSAIKQIGDLFYELAEDMYTCQVCNNISENEICNICASASRNKQQILVVEEPLDTIAFEDIGDFQGVYHVLGGVLSPVKGIGPNDISVDLLVERVNNLPENSQIEIIIATNPTLEGEATASYIQNLFYNNKSITLTRLARGLPSGADLDYADKNTLQRALEGRTTFQ